MIKFFNTLSGEKEVFKPIKEGNVSIYVCGMTVQNRPHLGHMRAYITADLIRRVFEYNGYTVKMIQNFTDIDDKVIERSKEFGMDYRVFGEQYIKEYIDSSMKMNILQPYYYPRATQHIDEIINLVEKLIEKGYAYVVEGDVYYKTEMFKDYGKLSGKKIEDLRSGARIEINPKKKNPLDFALWKGAKEGEPYWYSPWGKGRPGWHIECSAMSMKYLGETFDIHAGGTDLIFPHHENEIAQSEAATGKPFANYWIHNEMLRIKGEKMSKSLSNFLAVSDILKEISPNALRLYYYRTHFRSPLEYDENSLQEASSSFLRIERFISENASGNDLDEELFDKLIETLNDNFNTPKTLGLIFAAIKDANNGIKGKSLTANTVKKALNILGFELKEEKKNAISEKVIDGIVAIRDKMRAEKQFQYADMIREELNKLNIEILDSKNGTKWRIK
ncbi:cysteine--tRNA ligase [candidate division WOR-3 bacterium]|nr:cysteine--tRNA ligase [candidate division WOR-3 bacterium]